MSMDEMIRQFGPERLNAAAAVFDSLKELGDWVAHYRKCINKASGADLVPEVRATPDKKTYVNYQPVTVQYRHLAYMRTLRRLWDDLVANYEKAWDCPPCLRQRAMLVQNAAVLLNGAFTPQEVREARREQEAEKSQRAWERLQSHFRSILEADEEEEEDPRPKRRR